MSENSDRVIDNGIFYQNKHGIHYYNNSSDEDMSPNRIKSSRKGIEYENTNLSFCDVFENELELDHIR